MSITSVTASSTCMRSISGGKNRLLPSQSLLTSLSALMILTLKKSMSLCAVSSSSLFVLRLFRVYSSYSLQCLYFFLSDLLVSQFLKCHIRYKVLSFIQFSTSRMDVDSMTDVIKKVIILRAFGSAVVTFRFVFKISFTICMTSCCPYLTAVARRIYHFYAVLSLIVFPLPINLLSSVVSKDISAPLAQVFSRSIGML